MQQSNALIAENCGTIRSYRKRWYLLLVFFYYSFMNALQMTEYSSITETASRYYQVSTFAVNWTSLLYMVLYPVFVVPASYVIEKKGLRVASLCGCLGTALGTALKVLSIGRDRFWVVLLGQCLTAASQVFIVCLPPRIAAVWFKPSEISLACSLGTLGPNLGNAFGYLLTVTLVPDSKDVATIGENLKYLCWVLTGLMVPVSLAVIIFFPEKPPLPPSRCQGKPRGEATAPKLLWLKNLNISGGFMVHLGAYSIVLGVFSTLMILLSEIVNDYFKDAVEDGGKMGFCMMTFGVVGCVLFGLYLDKTHRYKEVTILLYLASTVNLMVLIVAMEKRYLTLAYVICSIFGIFINPVIPVAFEFGIELTFPSNESTIAGLLFAACQLMSVILGVAMAHVKQFFGSFTALTCLATLLTFATLMQVWVPNKLERQRMFKMQRHQTGTY